MRAAQLFLIVATAFGTGISGPALAGANDMVTGAKGLGTFAPPVVTPRGATTLVVGDLGGTTANAVTLTPVDSGERVSCKTTCSIVAAASVSMGSSTNTGYSVCLEIDGMLTDGCPYNGTASSYYTVSGVKIKQGLASGVHTVQTFVIVTATSNLYEYDIRYDVLK